MSAEENVIKKEATEATEKAKDGAEEALKKEADKVKKEPAKSG